QAEDGIRDSSVTGVQTCALPIYRTDHAQAEPRDGEEPQAPAPARIVSRRPHQDLLRPGLPAITAQVRTASGGRGPVTGPADIEEIGRASCRERVKREVRDRSGDG